MPSPVNLTFIEMSPILEVLDIRETINYYTSILGFDVDFTYSEDENEKNLSHAGLSFGNKSDTEKHSEEDIHTHLQITLSKEPINKCELFFTIGKEIYELFEVYKARNVKIRSPLQLMPWGIYEFYIEELNGHILRFTYTEES